MSFKSTIGLTGIAFLLIFFSKTATSSTVYQSSFHDGYGYDGKVFLVMQSGEATGMYFDYVADGEIDPRELLTTDPDYISGRGQYDIATTIVHWSDILLDSRGDSTAELFTLEATSFQRQFGELSGFYCEGARCSFGAASPSGLMDPTYTIGYVFDMVYTSAVPVPQALWLFGSGLIGLIGIARRKSHS